MVFKLFILLAVIGISSSQLDEIVEVTKGNEIGSEEMKSNEKSVSVE
jgi:hypothetical protein